MASRRSLLAPGRICPHAGQRFARDGAGIRSHSLIRKGRDQTTRIRAPRRQHRQARSSRTQAGRRCRTGELRQLTRDAGPHHLMECRDNGREWPRICTARVSKSPPPRIDDPSAIPLIANAIAGVRLLSTLRFERLSRGQPLIRLRPTRDTRADNICRMCGVVLLHAAMYGIVRHWRDRTTAGCTGFRPRSRVQLCSVVAAIRNRNKRQEKVIMSRNAMCWCELPRTP